MGARISTWNDTENYLMMSYLPHSDDESKIFMAFQKIIVSLANISQALGNLGQLTITISVSLRQFWKVSIGENML